MPGRARDFAERFDLKTAEKRANLREFARWQADAANAVVARLRALDRTPNTKDWELEYQLLTKERSTKATLFPDSRLDTLITDENPNADCFGPNIVRDGATWDPRAQRWAGGHPTPWSQTYAATGVRALARFRSEGVTGNELQNTVRLSDGTVVDGNRLLRNESAEQASRDRRDRLAARGIDVRAWRPPTPDEVFTITASEANRGRILADAFDQLATPGAFTTETWADVAYKLFQAPQMKNGSDAVIRTYLAAAAEYRLGRVPDFPHDIDLRAMTMSQRDFVGFVVDHDTRT
ncbi:hypothetical protein [Nocardia testacea]|uniref:Uncharacterized protein n=1 Tax=Nocardia testacea TaxID=248551 RepID=A0ABW7VVB1_9NOCA